MKIWRFLTFQLLWARLLGPIAAIARALFWKKRLAQPILQISEVLRAAAQGDLSKRVSLTTAGELGDLAASFNQLLEQLEAKNLSLSSYFKNLETQVQERTDALEAARLGIQGMINSLDQAFFMFDETACCLELHSRACLELLGDSPAQKPIWNVLRTQDQKAQANIRTWVTLLFDPSSDFEDLIPLGPKKLPNTVGKEILLSYHAVRDSSTLELRQVVVVATDATKEKDAKLKAEREAAYSQAILRIVRNRQRFIDFIRDAKAIFARAVEESDQPKIDINKLFRLIHTFKSAASHFSLFEVGQLAHELETKLAGLRNAVSENKPVMLYAGFRSDLDRIEKSLNEFLETNREFLGISTDPKEKLIEVPNILVELFKEVLEVSETSPDTVRMYKEYFMHEPIGRKFEFYDHVAQVEALRQEKELQPIVFRNGKLKIERERYDDLFASLSHIFRNAIAHGLETPRERREIGKNAAGQVTVAFEKFSHDNKDWLRIEIQDDGRGVSPDGIRGSLKKKGMTGWENDTDQQVIQRIFEPGFSTADQVTELAGRGVGLDAVRAEVTALGGQVRVDSLPGQGTQFTIEIPETA